MKNRGLYFKRTLILIAFSASAGLCGCNPPGRIINGGAEKANRHANTPNDIAKADLSETERYLHQIDSKTAQELIIKIAGCFAELHQTAQQLFSAEILAQMQQRLQASASWAELTNQQNQRPRLLSAARMLNRSDMEELKRQLQEIINQLANTALYIESGALQQAKISLASITEMQMQSLNQQIIYALARINPDYGEQTRWLYAESKLLADKIERTNQQSMLKTVADNMSALALALKNFNRQ